VRAQGYRRGEGTDFASPGDCGDLGAGDSAPAAWLNESAAGIAFPEPTANKVRSTRRTDVSKEFSASDSLTRGCLAD